MVRKRHANHVRNISNTRGLTAGEVIVVAILLFIMMAIMLPALARMRASTRLSNCRFNLQQLHLALENYAATHERFPSGVVNSTGPVLSVADGYHHNWIEGILPNLNASGLWQQIDRDVSIYHSNNDLPREARIVKFICPSASMISDVTSCYAAIHSSVETPIDQYNDGVFFLNSTIHRDDIVDGLNHTLFLGEKLADLPPDLGWLSGTRCTLRNTGHRLNQKPPEDDPAISPRYVGGLLSDHVAGLNTLFGSGETRFIDEAIDPVILRELASRNDSSREAN
ncbi:MAG: DUF1559 domain-containing protein [Planctomycetota bacterium]